jgi:hypothetical protein
MLLIIKQRSLIELGEGGLFISKVVLCWFFFGDSHMYMQATLLMVLNTTTKGAFTLRNQSTELSFHPQELFIIILRTSIGSLGRDHGTFIERVIGFMRVRVREGGRQSVFLIGFGVARSAVARVVLVAAVVMVVVQGLAK